MVSEPKLTTLRSALWETERRPLKLNVIVEAPKPEKSDAEVARVQHKIDPATVTCCRDVRHTLVYGRSFTGDQDLNAQALRWLKAVANVRTLGAS